MRWLGRKFGRLKVRFAVQRDKSRHAYFCCLCECGATVRVRGAKLISGEQKSCGCLRADPKVRREARLRVPAKKRLAIARAGSRASTKATRRSPYALDSHRAAEMLGVSTDRVEVLAKDGLIGHRYRQGALWVSADDVADLLAEQCRQRKRCAAETKLMLEARRA